MSEHIIETEISDGKLFIPYQDKLSEAVREEIVRCRDCKYWTDGIIDRRRYSEPYCGAIGELLDGALFEVDENDFCSWCERRDAE